MVQRALAQLASLLLGAHAHTEHPAALAGERLGEDEHRGLLVGADDRSAQVLRAAGLRA